jgi:hypothetical protein
MNNQTSAQDNDSNLSESAKKCMEPSRIPALTKSLQNKMYDEDLGTTSEINHIFKSHGVPSEERESCIQDIETKAEECKEKTDTQGQIIIDNYTSKLKDNIRQTD